MDDDKNVSLKCKLGGSEDDLRPNTDQSSFDFDLLTPAASLFWEIAQQTDLCLFHQADNLVYDKEHLARKSHVLR